MINQFIYDGIRSYEDMGLIITETPPILFPERDLSFDELPARDGSLINDAARWKNVSPEYKVAITDDKMTFDRACSELGNWLGSQSAYKVLTDTYDPEYYRLAVPTGAISITQKAKALGLVTIRFSAKPFRYSLLEGEKKYTLEGSDTMQIYNPEKIASRPLIRFETERTGQIRSVGIKINGDWFGASLGQDDDATIINSDEMTVYSEQAGTKKNALSTYTGDEWPILVPGWNTIKATDTYQTVTIIPKWRKL